MATIGRPRKYPKYAHPGLQKEWERQWALYRMAQYRARHPGTTSTPKIASTSTEQERAAAAKRMAEWRRRRRQNEIDPAEIAAFLDHVRATRKK